MLHENLLHVHGGQIKILILDLTSFMNKVTLTSIALLLIISLTACSKKARYTTKAVKPVYHHRYYDRKKDRHDPRTKTIKVKN
jgi:hypothetical protein